MIDLRKPAKGSAKVAGKSATAARRSAKGAGKSAKGAGKSAKAVAASATTGARATWSTLQIVMGVFGPERRRQARRKPSAPTVTAAAAAGAGLEYLLDPANGKRRRHALRQRVQGRSVTT